MKRQTQTVGVRKWAGDDLVSLQSETLKALDAFFAEYGPCVIQGCEITVSADGEGTYDVAAGLVALTADDQQGAQRVMVMPFAGATGVALPLYLTAAVEAITEAYGDGKVKPIAYVYTAQAVGADPGAEVPHLILTETGGNRFVDVVQDEKHRFISDNERAKWNAILQQAKEYADSVAATGSEAALRGAKEYTDQREVAILAAADTKDATTLNAAKGYADSVATSKANTALSSAKEYTNQRETAILSAVDSRDTNTLNAAKSYTDSVATTKSESALRSAKEYTDQREVAILAAADTKDATTLKTAKAYADTIVAALAGTAPETLDTLQELAAALGNDPNFSATVMQMIGERVTTEAMNAALAGKADLSNLAQIISAAIFKMGDEGKMQLGQGRTISGAYGADDMAIVNMKQPGRVVIVSASNPVYIPLSSTSIRHVLWHAGNFDPAQYFKGTSIGYLYDLETFSNRATGIYQVHATGAAQALLKLDVGTGSASGLELHWDYGSTIFRFRTTIDSNKYGAWHTIYHDGNLKAATASAAGLMSATDKAKLDAIPSGGMRLLGAGVYDGPGNKMVKKTGVVQNGAKTGGTGYFRITHNINNTNYEVQATCSAGGGSNGYVSIRSKTATYFDVYTGDDDSPNDLRFFFQIYEFA